ncbi:PREDICTED: uncharacterized protein LOC104759828 [Camelina sativa]|uniref:Uncharacterized protein LOC104759828 n=1 Tax=Camelina sativa TaxID=90675 RepID=A0ABM0X5G2_CAMSA|nr:PREDICTED: uncharacterized protein LOC104759828 [Camelina sativa]
MHPEKTPVPDGMSALFFQRFWPNLKGDLVALVKEFFRTDRFDPRLNETNICLIPKTERPKRMTEFRPISLCNVCYKIISKVLCFRLKRFLPSLVSETQSAFVSGRLITDNILVAQEMFHGLNTNPRCKSEFLAFKTDMSKAYDRVLINGQPRGYIKPQQGLRQGDPLSPYLFILCTEVLIANIKKAERDQRITGIKLARDCPTISHLLFADDSFFFCKAEVDECTTVMGIISDYGKASGQEVNRDKSSIMFGKKVLPELRAQLQSVMGISKEGGMGSYLDLTTKLTGAISKFWWKSNDKERGLHWVTWDKLCKDKGDGGLGFRALEQFNDAMLAKQYWRLIHYPSSLMTWVIRGRYFRNKHPLQAKKPCSPSLAWRSIFSTKDIVEYGARWVIGSGCNVSVWRDPWIPDTQPRPANGRERFLHPNLMVNHLINPSTKEWHLPILEEYMDPRDIQIILSMEISKSFKPDKLIWHYSSSGRYSVKSGYRIAHELIKEVEYGPTYTALKAQAWELKVPPKIQHFFWQMAPVIYLCWNVWHTGGSGAGRSVVDVVWEQRLLIMRSLSVPDHVVFGICPH